MFETVMPTLFTETAATDGAALFPPVGDESRKAATARTV
jgi:hypothetical protein